MIQSSTRIAWVFVRTYLPSISLLITALFFCPEEIYTHLTDRIIRFVIEDKSYNYISARFPGDAKLLGETIVKRIKEATNSGI